MVKAIETQSCGTPRNWKDLEYHELSEFTEFGVGIEIDKLADHIAEHGYDSDEAIVMYEKKILDGRHRHKACLKANVTPVFKQFTGDNPLAFVLKKIFRQHLDTSQRAMIAAQLPRLKVGRPAENGQKTGESTNPEISGNPLINSTQQNAAQLLNVSVDSLKQAQKVMDEGSKVLQDAVREGAIKVNDAAAICQEEKELQNKAVKYVKDEKAKTAKAAVKLIREEEYAAAQANEEQDEAEEAPEPVFDERGNEATPACEDAFRDTLPVFGEIESICAQLQKKLHEASELKGGEQLRPFLKPTGAEGKTINKSEELNTIRRNVKGVRPYAVCPYCKGSPGNGCRGCQRRGWVTKTTWDGAEDSLKVGMK